LWPLLSGISWIQGLGHILVRAEILPTDWEKYRVAGAPALQIVGAGGRRLKKSGAILLHVEICGLKTRMQFVVIPGLAAECNFGCQFIDRHVRSICNATCFSLFPDAGMADLLGALDSRNDGEQKCISR
jgi:hypothetical protein